MRAAAAVDPVQALRSATQALHAQLDSQLPLAQPVRVQQGDVLQVRFAYRAGGSIPSLQGRLEASVLYRAALQPQVVAYA